MRKLKMERCIMLWWWTFSEKVLRTCSKNADTSSIWAHAYIWLSKWYKESRLCTKRELFIEISNLITSWLAVLKQQKTQSISLILDLLNVTKALMVNIFHLEMARILLELPGMLVSQLISVMNNQEETISSQLDMCSYTSWEDHSHGKDFLVDQRLRNIPTLRKRRRKLP